MDIVLNYQRETDRDLAHTFAFFIPRQLKRVADISLLRPELARLCAREGGMEGDSFKNSFSDIQRTKIVDDDYYQAIIICSAHRKDIVEKIATNCSKLFYGSFPDQLFFAVHAVHETYLAPLNTAGFSDEAIISSIKKEASVLSPFRLERETIAATSTTDGHKQGSVFSFVFSGTAHDVKIRAEQARMWAREKLAATAPPQTRIVGEPQILASLETVREETMAAVAGVAHARKKARL